MDINRYGTYIVCMDQPTNPITLSDSDENPPPQTVMKSTGKRGREVCTNIQRA